MEPKTSPETPEKMPQPETAAPPMPETPAQPAPKPVAPETAGDTAAKEIAAYSTYRHIIPSYLSVIAEMKAVNGFVVITTIQGKEEVWPDLRVSLMAQDCVRMLRRIEEINMRKDRQAIPKMIVEQVQELMRKASGAAAAARYQRETLSPHDTEGKAVDRMIGNMEWQQGHRPERGSYSEDALPEEMNVRHYLDRFPYLKDYEIANILRNRDLPWDFRMEAMAKMNGMRAADELNLTAQEIGTAMATGQLPARLRNGTQGPGKPSQSPRKP